MRQKFEVTAREKSGVTFAELDQFVTQARGAGALPDSVVQVTTTWKGVLKTAAVQFDPEVAGPSTPPPLDDSSPPFPPPSRKG